MVVLLVKIFSIRQQFKKCLLSNEKERLMNSCVAFAQKNILILWHWASKLSDFILMSLRDSEISVWVTKGASAY